MVCDYILGFIMWLMHLLFFCFAQHLQNRIDLLVAMDSVQNSHSVITNVLVDAVMESISAIVSSITLNMSDQKHRLCHSQCSNTESYRTLAGWL